MLLQAAPEVKKELYEKTQACRPRLQAAAKRTSLVNLDCSASDDDGGDADYTPTNRGAAVHVALRATKAANLTQAMRKDDAAAVASSFKDKPAAYPIKKEPGLLLNTTAGPSSACEAAEDCNGEGLSSPGIVPLRFVHNKLPPARKVGVSHQVRSKRKACHAH